MTITPTNGQESTPPEGPDFEVWNHLESGWQMAYDDMARQLPPEFRGIYSNLGEATEKYVVPAKDVLQPVH